MFISQVYKEKSVRRKLDNREVRFSDTTECSKAQERGKRLISNCESCKATFIEFRNKNVGLEMKHGPFITAFHSGS